MGLDESKAQVDLTFSDEIEGRESFYLDFLPRVDSALNTDDVLNDYNDGVVRGNLLEFTFVLATLKTAKCRDLSNRPAVPLVA